MADLIYMALTSLDGYVADPYGGFGWAVPDAEVHSFVNERLRPVRTYLYGRRMYEVVSAWEHVAPAAGQPAYVDDFAAMWRAADKVVYSATLAGPTTARTRLERRFDPDAVRSLKTHAAGDFAIAGPTLAAHAFEAGLVDELSLFVFPVVVGGGKRALPPDERLALELREERRFASGVAYLRYRVRG